jgi:hypothetical protein
VEPDRQAEAVVVRVSHALLLGAMVRRFQRSRDGALVVRNQWFEKSPSAPRFTGSRIFARQVEALRALGVRRIELEAAGGPGLLLNGYYTWPRLGFDAPLTAEEQQRLPPPLAGAATLHELLTQPGGLRYWREHGSGREVVFELAPESNHSAILEVYLEVNGINVHGE